MDREAWRAAVHGVANSWTRLSDCTELKPYQNTAVNKRKGPTQGPNFLEWNSSK